MFTLRVHSSGEKASPSREERYTTKRELFEAIRRLGKLQLIRRIEPRVYSVRLAPKK